MANRMERFTPEARRVLSLAQEDAERLRHRQIGTEHLLLGLIRERQGIAAQALSRLAIGYDAVEGVLLEIQPAGSSPSARLDLSADTKRVLELSIGEARALGHHEIGTEHLLLGLARNDHDDDAATRILQRLGLSARDIIHTVHQILSGGSESRTTHTDAPRQIRLRIADKTSDAPLVDVVVPLADAQAILQSMAQSLSDKLETGQTGSLLTSELHERFTITLLLEPAPDDTPPAPSGEA